MSLSEWWARRPMRRLERALARAHPEQRRRFERSTATFAERYGRLSAFPFDGYVTPTWAEFNARLERELLPAPPYAFLENKVIRRTMFVRDAGPSMVAQRASVEAHVGTAEAAAWVREDPAGAPELHDAELVTSHNRLRHAEHMVAYEQATGRNLADPQRFVEWGGGYGGLARLVLRRHQGTPTYVIIDTPLFTCLQASYLCAVLGEDMVHIVDAPDGEILEGRVNLVPLGLFDALRTRIGADVFISTWALSESAASAQDAVVATDWFGAPQLVLAYQDASALFPDADRVGRLAGDAGAALIPVPFLEENTYAFR